MRCCIILKTFQEWSDLGYKILKGSKNRGKRGNEYLFGSDQVVHTRRSFGSARPSVYTRPNGEQAGYLHDAAMEIGCEDVDYDDPTLWDDFTNF